MELAIQLIVLGFLVEAIVETIKLLWKGGKLNTNQLISLVVGELIAISVGIDIFVVIGVESNLPIIGVVLTGILISRGASFVHDFVDRIKGVRNNEVKTSNNAKSTI